MWTFLQCTLYKQRKYITTQFFCLIGESFSLWQLWEHLNGKKGRERWCIKGAVISDWLTCSRCMLVFFVENFVLQLGLYWRNTLINDFPSLEFAEIDLIKGGWRRSKAHPTPHDSDSISASLACFTWVYFSELRIWQM